jgi:hypothetical protein
MYTGIIYIMEDGEKPEILVSIRLDKRPNLWDYDTILDKYSEKYLITRQYLKLVVCDCIPDPR